MQSPDDGFCLARFTDLNQRLYELRRDRESAGLVYSLSERVLPDRPQALDSPRGIVRQ